MTTVALRVVPVRVPAGAITTLVPAAVIRPLPLTVKLGIAVLDPNEPVFEFTVARVVALPVEVTSPVKLALVVTVPALPVIEPVMVLVTERLVVVAFVVVLLRPVKFWRVVEPVTRTCPPSFANKVFGSK